jgi:hypothetical protein
MGRWWKQDNPAKRFLSRRAVLRGLGGAVVALPLLEIMLESDKALAGTQQRRYGVFFAGQSMGADGDDVHNLFVPDMVGQGYDLKTATEPFSTYDVANEITIVSGLSIPTANGGSVPAGGRSDDFHINNMGPLLTGVRSADHDKGGASSDQIMQNAIGGGTVHPGLIYQVQAAWYLSVSAPYGRDIMSVRDEGGGNLTEIQGTVSPKLAYDNLFYMFAPPDDEAAAAAQDFAWRQRKSVVDLVKRRAERLVTKLGGADKQRIERHLDEIRDLETRISAIPPAPGGECQQFTDPGPDPTLGGNQPDGGYDQNLGYSDEQSRARVFMDLVHMAFTCDLSRVAACLMTMAQSHMNMNVAAGLATDLHEISHNGVPGGTQAVATAQAWQIDHFCYLVDKLRNTPEGNGTVLDNCALVWLWEGGHGDDPSTGNVNSSHSTQNMALAIAGGAGGLKRGHHVVAPSNRSHPGNAIITAMRAAGYDGDTFGEVTGDIPDLLT